MHWILLMHHPTCLPPWWLDLETEEEGPSQSRQKTLRCTLWWAPVRHWLSGIYWSEPDGSTGTPRRQCEGICWWRTHHPLHTQSCLVLQLRRSLMKTGDKMQMRKTERWLKHLCTSLIFISQDCRGRASTDVKEGKMGKLCLSVLSTWKCIRGLGRGNTGKFTHIWLPSASTVIWPPDQVCSQ